MTHVLMLRDGEVVASGPIDRTLTSANLSDCFGLPLTLETHATTADSARGRHEIQQALPTRCDLLGQHPLEHAAGPQRAAVVQVHRQRAEPVALDDRRVEHPRRVVAPVGLIALERRTVNVSASRTVRTIRSRLLRASGPRRARSSTSHAALVTGLRDRAVHEAVPLRIRRQVVDELEQSLGWARCFERGGDIHRRKYRRFGARSRFAGQRRVAAVLATERSRQQGLVASSKPSRSSV